MQVFLHLGEAPKLVYGGGVCLWASGMWREQTSTVNWKGKKPQNFLQCLNLILNRKSCFMLPVGSVQPLLTLELCG